MESIKTWIKKCPVLLLVAVSGVLFSVVGIIGSNSVYKEYDFNMAKQPFLALMMEGMSRDIAPWEVFGIGGLTAREDGMLTEEGEEDGEEMQGELPSDGQGAESYPVAEQTEEGLTSVGQGTETGVPSESDTELMQAESQGTDGEWQSGQHDGAQIGAQSGVQAVEVYEFQTVTEDYFNDAVFIGDSRTVGLYEYAGMEERADFYAKVSMTIYDVFTEKVVKDERTGRKITIEEALSRKQYGKVYLMLGINEMGTGTTESFMKKYTAVVERLRELQPDAVIFVQGIMRVTGEKNKKDPIFNNRNINEKNEEIAKLADNEYIFYIDVNEVVCDEEGNLNNEYTIDDIHLKAKYYTLWKDFLLEHGVVKE